MIVTSEVGAKTAGLPVHVDSFEDERGWIIQDAEWDRLVDVLWQCSGEVGCREVIRAAVENSLGQVIGEVHLRIGCSIIRVKPTVYFLAIEEQIAVAVIIEGICPGIAGVHESSSASLNSVKEPVTVTVIIEGVRSGGCLCSIRESIGVGVVIGGIRFGGVFFKVGGSIIIKVSVGRKLGEVVDGGP